ncbi:hypothetical protein DFP72DRAFT_1076279 [Ephemerocybe angulata]|uniref:Uncharacterized protein n=1 Tax=Ephemerocybe angulata TaxID=980116 RepID=A0A8H6LZU3_9AGAR|nr:hypothetical protein DFP72DRAFT_1076279 [Tulosesus angulatus]
MLFGIEDELTSDHFESILEEEVEARRMQAFASDQGLAVDEEDDLTVPQHPGQPASSWDYDSGEEPARASACLAGAPHAAGGSRRFWPYPNETACILDTLDNFPRMRLSSSHMKIILWAMKRCNPSDVPSYDGFRKMQKRLGEQINVKTV